MSLSSNQVSTLSVNVHNSYKKKKNLYFSHQSKINGVNPSQGKQSKLPGD